MTSEPSCSLVEALALVQERVSVQGPKTPIAGDDRGWGWLVPILLACGRVGWSVTVIPDRAGVTLQLPRALTATEQAALTNAWQGEAVDAAALPVDAWDWYGCRLRAGARTLTVRGDRLIFTAGGRPRGVGGLTPEEEGAPRLRTVKE
ncbi:MAG TPA: hypothetical protein DCQ32_07905, partial [Cyanobacteria bacterium UBA8156]|nr:hypothetical protein [Cyanobacteria bacterium UBA8156]